MIVPRYWSEATTKTSIEGRQFTLKRFGWSDTSEQDAGIHARSRLDEALEVLVREGDVRRVDHKAAYNGAEGMPIREEVIATRQDVVISRNSYGALCLNTPDVLFADIDFEFKAPASYFLPVSVPLSAMVSALALFYHSWPGLITGLFATVILSVVLGNIIRRMRATPERDIEQATVERIKQLSRQSPELNIRLYRTPAGLRALLLNDTYAPASEAALTLLKRLQSDRVYIQMCRNQECFRARVSPKPWRIGLDRIRPSPGIWPVRPERLEERTTWVDEYTRRAEGYASCRFLLQLGSTRVHRKADFVRQIHDDMCKVSRNDLDLA